MQSALGMKGLSEEQSSMQKLRHFNTFNAKLNPICHLITLFGAHHIFHVSRVRVNY
jgi:hypothetical protein